MPTSRGENVSAYIPAFSKGAKVYTGNMKYSITSGTLATDAATVAIAHGLGAIPATVIVTMKGTAAKLNQSASACVGEASASARTATNVYIAGSAGTMYQVYCIL